MTTPQALIGSFGGADGLPESATVELLLHGDGLDGAGLAADFVDSSGLNHVPNTVSGDPTLVTATKKFGTASIYFDGNDYLNYASSTDWAVDGGDFTVECFVNLDVQDVLKQEHIWQFASGTQNRFILYVVQTTKNLAVGVAQNAGGYTFNGITGPVLLDDTWYHIAVVRKSGTIRLYVAGVEQGTALSGAAATMPAGANDLALGWQPHSGTANDFLTGWIDEFRFVKGYAVYSSNFTPPTAPFPNP